MSEFIVGKIQQLMDGKQEKTISDLERQLAEAKAEVEAMRPVVEKVKAYKTRLRAYSPAVLGSECVTAKTEMFKALDEYEARK